MGTTNNSNPTRHGAKHGRATKRSESSVAQPFQTALRAIVVAIPLVFVVGTVLVLSAPDMPSYLAAKSVPADVKPVAGRDRDELAGMPSHRDQPVAQTNAEELKAAQPQLTKPHASVYQAPKPVQADFVLLRDEFSGDSAAMTPQGRDHVMEIAARMRSSSLPILIEPSDASDPELDAHRRRIVVQMLTDFGNPDAYQRTFVSQPNGDVLSSASDRLAMTKPGAFRSDSQPRIIAHPIEPLLPESMIAASPTAGPSSPRIIPETPVPPPSPLDPYGDLKPEYKQPADPGFRFFSAKESRPLHDDAPGMILSQVATRPGDDRGYQPRGHNGVDAPRVAIRRPKASDYRIQFGPVEEPPRPEWRVADRSPYYSASMTNRTQQPPASQFMASNQPTMSMQNLQKIESQLVGMNQRIDLMAQAQMQQAQNDQLKFLQEMHQQLEAMKKRAMEDSKGETGQPANGQPVAQSPQPGASPNAGPNEATQPVGPPKDPVLKVERSENKSSAGANDRFSLQIEDTPITEVLEMLGELAGKNVLTSSGVTGFVSANLQDVTVDEALDALLKVRQFAYERDARFIYVMTQAEVDAKEKAARKVISKVYRPNYISAKELQTLITPLLTQNVGVVAVTTAPDTGLAPDAATAGGDSMTQQDALLVQDYDTVIDQVDQIIDELDVPPAQVVIEALILQVDLSDEMAMGVNFALLGDNGKNFSVVGNGATLNGSVGFPQSGNALQGVGDFVLNTAGLKYGFIQGDVTAFIDALETITDVNTVASPTIRALNKQKAQLIIGQQLAYTETTTNGNTTQTNVNFLDVGTKLFVRPFIAPDGYVRMEVNPELSQGSIDNRGLPNTTTAQVTTNVMIKDGATIVIGGLISETVNESTSGVPLLSSLPGVGQIFQNKSDQVTRTELMVLLTPRIVGPYEAAARGELARNEQLDRARDFKHGMAPSMRMQMSRTHFEWAQRAFEDKDYVRASYHINQAERLTPNNLEVLRLKKLIEGNVPPRSWLPGFERDSSPVGRVVPPAPSGPVRRGPVARRLRPGLHSPTRLR